MGMSAAVLGSIKKPASELDFEFDRGNANVQLSTSTRDRLDALDQLHKAEQLHPFWNNRLFGACQAGHLTLEDFRFIFSQYYLYSQNFTRYLAAIMANCDNDYFRARLSENMWEEGGGASPENRHSEIFRNFLRDGLSVDIDEIDYLDFAHHFMHLYLDFCLRAAPAAASAFFSLGTEGIVARTYQIFVDGLKQAGIEERHLTFFRLHMECDDEHAATLEEMMLSYSDEPDWYETCRRAMNHALNLRERFFDNLYEAIRQRRVQGLLDRIQSRQPLALECPDPACFIHVGGQVGMPLYTNTNARLNIDFSVDRVPFSPEVLDPRIVRIPAGKYNEKHRHAHETVFYIIEGSGRVLINETPIDVAPGDIVFVPRWAMHQSQNLGNTDMTILAVTDYGLTGTAYIGSYLKTARMTFQVKGREANASCAAADTARIASN
jgi:pyrroloquinoline quinone (PQQ) biosynthesis protein C/mannose-6-phosphate isomerase-like protein (cupin superfamily)